MTDRLVLSKDERPFDAAIGLGSNVGDKRANIARAIKLLTARGDIVLVGRSRDYRSAPWGVLEQDWFVNAVITVATGLGARDLLARCQDVETQMGRVRLNRWGPRLIDVDVLTYRDQHIDDDGLIVPHPFIAERSFVLVPLREVAPTLRIGGESLDALIGRIDMSDLAAL
ncbi:MAG TPA: 2-amino-4-hydroxy-6-hydroxymethyldihydropteridine diphosphokinase [Hyphomicrobium sp.]|nr:2-amino-4-hydroxy-6-hydroxymethyldihydropteridine diphosphokinase [Hyphomicrobium sp.]